MFDGIVALVFIHFGIFDLDGRASSTKDSEKHKLFFGHPKLAKILKHRHASRLRRLRRSRPDIQASSYGMHKVLSERTAALSVDALIAITELCLKGVFSGTVLSDIIALFTLGDVDNGFCEAPGDTELLHAFLHNGLMPRRTEIWAKFGGIDRSVMLNGFSGRQNKYTRQVDDAESRLILGLHRRDRVDSTGKVPSFTVPRWTRRPQLQPSGMTHRRESHQLRTCLAFSVILIRLLRLPDSCDCLAEVVVLKLHAVRPETRCRQMLAVLHFCLLSTFLTILSTIPSSAWLEAGPVALPQLLFQHRRCSPTLHAPRHPSRASPALRGVRTFQPCQARH